METKAITANVSGGEALKRHFATVERQLGKGTHINVGFLSSATYPVEQARADREKFKFAGKRKTERRERNVSSKLFVAQVAFWQCYGTKKIPPRNFMQKTFDSKSPRWGIALGAALRQENYHAEPAMAEIGNLIVGQIRRTINEWTTPPNAAYTVSMKGFNKPLTDTAVMLRSVDFELNVGAIGASDK